MEKQYFLNLLREVKSVSMATVNKDGLPKVRIIDVMLVENEKLYFCTARGKDFFNELMESKQIAIVGMNKNYQTVRLNGKVHHLSNQKEWIDRIFEENPVMNDIYPNESRYILEAFCISDGELEYFDLSTTPISRKYDVLGNVSLHQKGYEIQDNCIQCGLCLKNCPQKCIKPGTKYKIIQENCLHCGLCYEVCPAKAIKRMG